MANTKKSWHIYGEVHSGGENLKKKRASLQALKLLGHKLPPQGQGFKRNAQAHKLQDPGSRVQAHKPTSRGTGNEDKGIFFVFHVKGNLVRGKDNFGSFCYL